MCIDAHPLRQLYHRRVARPGDDLNWDDLRYFLRAAEAKSLAGAARAMRVEHTTIGRRLTALEEAFGVALVIRRPDGLMLTPAGERALPLVLEVERAVTAVRESVASQQARVRVALPTGLAAVLTPHLGRLQREHPGIELELLTGSRPVDLSKGEADIAVRVGPVSDRDLISRKLGQVGASLYASEAYLAKRPPPADPTNLAGHDVIAYDRSFASLPAAQWVERHATGANIVLRCREMSEMVAAAVSGVGVALLSCWLADQESTLRRLTDDVLILRDLSIVYRREARQAKPVRAAIALLTEILRESELANSSARPAAPRG